MAKHVTLTQLSTGLNGLAAKSDARFRKVADKIAKTDLADALAQAIDDVVNESAGNKSAIETLNGTGAGSVSKAIDDAFNEFSTKVSNDNVVNTYKELIDYAASHSAEFTELVGVVSGHTAKLVLGQDANEKEYATVKAYVEAYVAAQLTASALTQGNGIEITDGTVSAKVVEGNGLSVGTSGIAMGAATQTAAGAMSAADKVKLDGFEEATDAEVTAILDAIWPAA